MKQSFTVPINLPVTNLLTHSEDYSFWTGTAQVVGTGMIGPDGETKNASQLQDNSATAVQGLAMAQAIPANTQNYTASVYFRKTNGAANTVGLNLALSGGTPLTLSARLNTDTGVCSAGFVDDAGSFWRLSVTLANNSTNTTITLTVYPATGTNTGSGPGADAVATTGTAILAGSQVEKGAPPATAYNSTTTTSGVHITTLVQALKTWAGTEAPFIHDLFTITLANGLVIRATDGQLDIVSAGQVFYAMKWGKWKRGSITSEASFDVSSSEMELDFVDTDADAGGSVTVLPNVFLLQAVYSGFFDAATVQVQTAYMPTYGDLSLGLETKFLGDITSVKELDRAHAKFGVADLLYRLKQPWPPNVYQSACRHSLFNSNCGLNVASYQQSRSTGAGTTQNLIVVTLPLPAFGTDPLPFTQGQVKFTTGNNAGLTVSIRQQLSTTQLKLDIPALAPILTGTGLIAFPGCNKLLETCNGKYGNLIHFGGQPYTPAPETVI